MQNLQRCYILIGDENAWKISAVKNIWGFSENSKGLWNTSKIGDAVAFYVTSPIKKIMGFGIISEKFIDENLIWDDEKLFKRSIWKYKLKFDILYMLEDWNNGINTPKNMMLNIGRKLVNDQIFQKLVKDADMKWKTNLYKKLFN